MRENDDDLIDLFAPAAAAARSNLDHNLESRFCREDNRFCFVLLKRQVDQKL